MRSIQDAHAIRAHQKLLHTIEDGRVSGKKVKCGSIFEGTKEMVQIDQFPFKGTPVVLR